MSNAQLPSWANGTVKEAADMLARTALEKRALPSLAELGQTLSGYASKAKGLAKAHPDIAKPLGVAGGAAAIGGGLAGLSSLMQPEEERHTLRSIRRGMMGGGLLGAGGYAAVKSLGLNKKIPGLYDKANKAVSDLITGGSGPSDRPVPGLDQADDVMGTMGLSPRDMDADLIGKANKAELAEKVKALREASTSTTGAVLAGGRDGFLDVAKDTGKKVIVSPTGLSLGLTGAGDVATRQLGASAASRGMVDVRTSPIRDGIARLRAAGGASDPVNNAALKELFDMPAQERVRHFQDLNDMVNSRGYSGKSYRVLPGGSKLTRDFAQAITDTPNRRGGIQSLRYLLGKPGSSVPTSGARTVGSLARRGANRAAITASHVNPIGGRWGKVLSLLTYLAAAGAPHLLSGESASPIIRDMQQPQAPAQ